MRLQSIEIDKLFFKNHIHISLHNEDRITILHGPNGSGKTTILDMLNNFFKLNFRDLSKIPFGELSFNFDNNFSIRVYKNFLYAIGLNSWGNFENLKDIMYKSDSKILSDEKFVIKVEYNETDTKIHSFYYSLTKNDVEFLADDHEYVPLNVENYMDYKFEADDEKLKQQITEKIHDIKILKELDEKNKKYYETFSGEKLFIKTNFDINEIKRQLENKKELYYIHSSKSRKKYEQMEKIQKDIDELERELAEFQKIGGNKKNTFEISNFIMDNSFLESLQNSDYSRSLLIYNLLSQLNRDIRPKVIESQRLKDTTPRRQGYEFTQTRKERGFELVVNQCAEDLINYIQDANKQYNDISKQIDQAFPKRLMESILGEKKQDLNSLRDNLEELRQYQDHLTAFGLYKHEKDITSEYSMSNIENRPEVKPALNLYYQDTKEKLAVYKQLDEKMKKFSSIISDLFWNKTIKFTPERGFFFIDSETHIELSLENLSSGEQNIIVMLFRLIFQIPKNSLVLIDEPEISLHIGWQRKFLKILSEIVSIKPMDIIISTHSPGIIADRQDLLIQVGKAEKI